MVRFLQGIIENEDLEQLFSFRFVEIVNADAEIYVVFISDKAEVILEKVEQNTHQIKQLHL